MSRLAADTDWLRRIGGLTVEPDGQWPHDQIVAARLLVVRLVSAARAAAASPRAVAACPPTAAALVGQLSAVDVPELPRDPTLSPSDLTSDYLRALCSAAGAVYFCRRVEHASGRCWFSVQGPAADVCGRVLAAGHYCSRSADGSSDRVVRRGSAPADVSSGRR